MCVIRCTISEQRRTSHSILPGYLRRSGYFARLPAVNGAGSLLFLLKYFVIALVQFIIAQVGVALRDLDIAVSC